MVPNEMVYDALDVGINFHLRILVLEALVFSYGFFYFATFSMR